MPVTFCKACGEEVSSQATTCSNCGAPVGQSGGPTPTSSDIGPLEEAAPHRASDWQRIVSFLTGVVLVGSSQVVLHEWEGSAFGYILIVAGAGFGLAALLPPHGILRRLWVGVGGLILLASVGTLVFFIIFFFCCFEPFGGGD